MKAAAFVLLASVAIAGCRRSKSPYDYMDNWLIREDAVRPFAVVADVIYIQDRLYVDMKSLPAMHYRAKQEVGNGRFDGFARVFSPLVMNADDLELAMEWYFRYHSGDRPLVFIGEGAGGALLREYEVDNLKSLKSKGFICGFYSELENGPFVTAELVSKIRIALLRSRYRDMWKREIPEGMLEDAKND